MTERNHKLAVISEWMLLLAKLTRYRQWRMDDNEQREWEAELAAYVDILAMDDAPAWAYNNASMRNVIVNRPNPSYFPSYPHIRATVHAWWRAHEPEVLQVEGPKGGLNREEASWLARHEATCKRISDKKGKLSDRYIASELARMDSLLKQQAFNAWLTLHPEEVHEPWVPPPNLLRIALEAWDAPDAQTRKELTYDPPSTVPPALALPAPDQQRPPDHQRPLGRRDVAFSGDRLQQIRARRAKP